MSNYKRKELAKNLAKDLALLISESSLYPAQHPNVIAQIKKTLGSAEEFFALSDEAILDLFEGQFAFEGIPLYDIKHAAEKSVELLENKSIKSIVFKKGLTPQMLLLFVGLLVDKRRPLLVDGIQMELKKAAVENIVLYSQETAETDTESFDLIAGEKIYGSSIEANKLVYKALQSGQSIPTDIVDKVASDITELIAKDTASSIALATLRDYDEYTFTHSANVAILSVTLASHVTKDRPLLNNLARAALLHDIGKIQIPSNVLNKPEKLTDEEWMMMKQHPSWGAKILEQQKTVDRLAVVIAIQHHMRYDLTGYPQISGTEKLHPFSLIVNICDIYDAITSKRPYKKPMAADKALSLMLRLVGCDFDPQFFKLFTQMIGVYPPGSFVRLNTGEIAVIKRIRPQALVLPDVKIILDEHEKKLDAPLLINLGDKSQNPGNRHVQTIIDPADLGLNPIEFLA